jgi:hypothetical protein
MLDGLFSKLGLSKAYGVGSIADFWLRVLSPCKDTTVYDIPESWRDYNAIKLSNSEQVALLKQDIREICSMLEPCAEAQLLAVRTNILSIAYIARPTQEAQLEAVKLHPIALGLIEWVKDSSNRYTQPCELAVSYIANSHPHVLAWCSPFGEDDVWRIWSPKTCYEFIQSGRAGRGFNHSLEFRERVAFIKKRKRTLSYTDGFEFTNEELGIMSDEGLLPAR